MIEMWGYAVAAASIGLKHQEYRDFQARIYRTQRADTYPLCAMRRRLVDPFYHYCDLIDNTRVQVEPGALSSPHQLRDFTSRYWIFHYTYQFEYMLDGTACKRNQPHNQPYNQPWSSVPSSL